MVRRDGDSLEQERGAGNPVEEFTGGLRPAAFQIRGDIKPDRTVRALGKPEPVAIDVDLAAVGASVAVLSVLAYIHSQGIRDQVPAAELVC